MSSEPLHIFDPRRNFQTQGFTGKAATTTLYNATETSVSISGIFQAPDACEVIYLAVIKAEGIRLYCKG